MKEELKLKNQLCFRLYTASRLITQAYHPYLSPLGITYPQYLVLMVLWENDRLPVNDIAKKLYLETNTVTPLLKRMESEGIIRRERGKDDARQVIVSLTEKGRSLEQDVVDIPMKMAEAVSCRSITKETAPVIFETLDHMIQKLAP